MSFHTLQSKSSMVSPLPSSGIRLYNPGNYSQFSCMSLWPRDIRVNPYSNGYSGLGCRTWTARTFCKLQGAAGQSTTSAGEMSQVSKALLSPRALRTPAPAVQTSFGSGCNASGCQTAHSLARFTRFPSRPLMIRVPFLLLFGFNKETP